MATGPASRARRSARTPRRRPAAGARRGPTGVGLRKRRQPERDEHRRPSAGLLLPDRLQRAARVDPMRARGRCGCRARSRRRTARSPSPRRRRPAARVDEPHVVAATAAVYSHYIAALVLVPQAAWALWTHRESARGAACAHRRRRGVPALAAIVRRPGPPQRHRGRVHLHRRAGEALGHRDHDGPDAVRGIPGPTSRSRTSPATSPRR
jgi:hypothetical protein